MNRCVFTLAFCFVSCFLLLTGDPSAAENKPQALAVLRSPQRVFPDVHFVRAVAAPSPGAGRTRSS
jgi:hypothetical protein